MQKWCYISYFTWFELTVNFMVHETGHMKCTAWSERYCLEAFAGQIPQGTIRLNSQVKSIKKSETSPDVTNVELQDGSTYSAKVWPTLHALSNLQLQVSLSNYQSRLDILHVSCYKIIHYVWQVANKEWNTYRFRILSGTTILEFDGCIFLRTSKVGAWAHFVKTEWANVLGEIGMWIDRLWLALMVWTQSWDPG